MSPGAHNALWRAKMGRYLPMARIFHGSVYQRTLWGFTHWHAVRRADRYITEQASQ